jgi:excisionase family DNA binding protein
MADDSLLTTEEVLDYLNLNLKTVYRLVKAGKLPAVRVGRQWRFRKRDIDTWLQRGSAPEAAVRSAGNRPTVLVVDDDESVREMLSSSLSAAAYEVVTAADGSTALAALQQTPCDLLMADLKMPGMDGMTLIREARKRSPALPVVIVTGLPSEASAIEAIDIGVSGYLTKPFVVSKLLDVVARALAAPAATDGERRFTEPPPRD